jgi:hypothetical protein
MLNNQSYKVKSDTRTFRLLVMCSMVHSAQPETCHDPVRMVNIHHVTVQLAASHPFAPGVPWEDDMQRDSTPGEPEPQDTF